MLEALPHTAGEACSIYLGPAKPDIRMTQIAHEVRAVFLNHICIGGVALGGSENAAIEPEHGRTIGRHRGISPSPINIVNAGR